MIEYDPSAQPRFISPNNLPIRKPHYIQEVFDEPDFISLNLKNKTEFQLRWAAHDEVFKELDPLSDLIESVDGRGVICKSAVPYTAEGEGQETLPTFEDRIQGFSVLTDSISLHVLDVTSSPAHQKPTNEVWINLKRNDTAARYIVSHCVAITARDGVGENADAILDYFAEYLPILKG